MPKKILVVDDSALMRRVLCDIIDADIRFQVVDRAKDGLEAFDLLSRNSYDAVVLDVNMPRMNGLQLLQELRKYKIPARKYKSIKYSCSPFILGLIPHPRTTTAVITVSAQQIKSL